MFCVKCGASLPDDANFCFKCGCDLRNLNQRTGTETCAVKIDEASSSVSYLKCLSDMSSSLVKVGDYVKFGSYPQNNIEAKEPIEWLVLVVNGNEALLLSRYGLDCKKYYHQYVNVTWEKCDLRKWLNNDFLKAAFSKNEIRRIKESELSNDDNYYWKHTIGGNSARDRVFCFSIAEANQYFRNDEVRKCQPTEYAKNQGTDVGKSNGCCWWLRSPGGYQDYASYVMEDGALNPYGDHVDFDYIAVRPALRIILNQ